MTMRWSAGASVISEKTVKNYVSALFAKLGMHHRTQAAAYAVRVFGDHHHHDGDGEPHLSFSGPGE
jgi:hypothetical protein